jgi:hypothetical protein
MVRTNRGGLPTAVLHGGSPPPFTFDTRDLNFLSKNWSKSMVHSPDLFGDALKRPITTIPPSITTAHHDGGLPSPFDDNPPSPSTHTQCSRNFLRERHHIQDGGWTKWEAVQLTDKLEAKQDIEKAKWDLWKEAGK